MIVRKEPDGTTMLVGQTDHSRLVGQFAAHWGNADFDVPRPYDSVVRAATFHDFGWLRYETSPMLDEASGEVANFLQIPSSPSQLEGFQWCIDWLTGIDPYAGLVAGMHRTGLWRERYKAIAHPDISIRHSTPDVEAFIARNEAQQKQAEEAFDPHKLRTNYRLLQIWDLLGLYFCCQEPCEDYIEASPLRYTDGENQGTRITLTPITKTKVKLDPFPFDARPCHVQLSYKRLPRTKYPTLEAFRRDYFGAPVAVTDFELV